jgi:Uma2 family endonuclease
MPEHALLTYEDLENFPDDNLRREVIDGELYVTPAPSRAHQHAVGEIFVALRAHAKCVGGEALVAPFDIILSAQNVVEPDVLYVAPDRMHTLGKRAAHGVPSLFVEVLSPSTTRADRGKKREAYARFGVPEYWIVDVEKHTIERCSDPVDGLYRTIVVFDHDMAAATLPDFILSFEEIFVQ